VPVTTDVAVVAGSTYVAMGSSMAAGPGIPPIVDRGAMRSGRNYPHQLADLLGLHLIDATVSGATTATVLHEHQRTTRGRVPPQITSLVPETALVTLTIGGNDVSYVGGLIGASARGTASRLPLLLPPVRSLLRGSPRPVASPAAYDAVTDGIVAIVEQVRATAPDARVVLVDYLTLVGPDAVPCRRLPLAPEVIAEVRQAAQHLNAAIARAAEATGADLVAASEASTGHGVGSAEPWVTGFELGNPLRSGRIPFHANLAGMTVVANLLAALLRDPQQHQD
jgi:lysophospholipase L1-like esterase